MLFGNSNAFEGTSKWEPKNKIK